MQILKQSTASQSVLIGPFVDDTDGATAETGLTIANTDIRLSANGGNMFAKTSGGGTHDEIGYYAITLDATDTATVGRLQLAVDVAGALPVYHEYQVVEEAVAAAFFDASAVGIPSIPANWITATGIASNAITAAKIATDAITAAKIAADAIGASELAADAVTEIQSGIATAAELAKVPKSDGTASWNATALAAINAEADTALSDYDPPTKTEMDSGFSGLNDPDAAAVADAVWDEDATGHQTGGTFGQAIGDPGANTETMYDAVVTDAAGTNVAADVIAVKAETSLIVADTNELQTDDIPGAIAALDTVVDRVEADTQDLQTQIGTAGAGLTDLGGMSTGMKAEVNAEADTAISDASLATAAALATVDGNVDSMVAGIINGTAQTGTLSTTVATTDLSGYTDDQLIGRIITVLTGSAAGESSDITDYANTGGTITFTAMTLAMANGDTFKIT